jgi:chemotaxis signal transduction protein
VGPFLDQVPGLPRWFCGLTPLGQEEAGVVDLGDYLGLGQTLSVRPRTALLLVRRGSPDSSSAGPGRPRAGQTVGFSVTDLLGTREVPVDSLHPVPPPAESAANHRVLAGAAEVGGELLVILSPQMLLSDAEWAKLTRALKQAEQANR